MYYSFNYSLADPASIWGPLWSATAIVYFKLYYSDSQRSPGSQVPSIKPPPYRHAHTYTQTRTRRHTVYDGRIVLIYPASSINHIISNNCHRQLGSQLRDFILIDFLTCSQPWMIWFPSDTMFIKGILHKGINRYCWLDLYELGRNGDLSLVLIWAKLLNV